MDANQIAQRRQALYWRLLTAMFGFTEQGANFEEMSVEIVDELGLPQLILDPKIGIDDLLQRYPELEANFTTPILPESPQEFVEAGETPALDSSEAGKMPTPQEQTENTDTLRRALVFSKLLLNAFGPNTQTSVVTAQQYAQWLKDCAYLQKALNCSKGSQQPGAGAGGSSGTASGMGAGSGSGAGTGTGQGFTISEEQLRTTLKAMEGELIDRMALREVLKDDQLAAQLTPSVANKMDFRRK